ncbi:NADP-dependent isocitrate dehydrogenase [Rhodohalobacter mucosus]|uniref:Isocitrate dehydrogenase [NADP] n=1 Tax=Rhodohalobacter mucosus TaxID=2079485 RepID=A0A316TWE1_9BACT|nr:NADP-dependent isocitrate dehydrogenase [Rhodohalobacter mucosus]PWN06882.1 NADP-dependent isocitrate dehydrogenase [Rhodohalobacter mucosus]
MKSNTTITVAYGDGIGPEIMTATLNILNAAGANLTYDVIEIGEKVYRRGIKSGIEPSAWDPIRKNRVLLKAPITTPQGGGVKSLNVTMRKTLGLYANVRPCRSYAPFVRTKHPGMDVVIVRENEEDTYGGIEHRQTYDVFQCLKLITMPGTEKIVRYAFEYARRNDRKKLTCFTKDNIMKLTDGLFHDMFKQVGAEYPEIESENMIVDIGAARLADTPERFDVVVMPNLYGDIISDIAAQIAGSVGLAGSANIGEQCAMFEAIHGSAPDIAGQNIANPSGLLMASVMMLIHLGDTETAETIQNAWLKTLEEGLHTADIYDKKISDKLLTTDEFEKAVIERLGKEPEALRPVHYPESDEPLNVQLTFSRGENQPSKNVERKLKGVDLFACWQPGEPDDLAKMLKEGLGSLSDKMELIMITNRGTKVWPEGLEETFCTDHWRCRFVSVNGDLQPSDIIALLSGMDEHNIDIVKTENLYEFDGQRAYSLGQGE